MDVELQILKHLARAAQPSIVFIDDCCNSYKNLFAEVRSYECFKWLHLGIISTISRKSLPEISKITGINSAQSLHHFMARSPWSVETMREKRFSREIIYGKRRAITYWEITTDPQILPENSTSFVMTNIQGKIGNIVGNLYGSRTWVECSFSLLITS